MPIQSFGDMSQHFQSLRQTGTIKSQLSILTRELASGLVADPAAHLGGDTRPLSHLNRDIAVLESFGQATTETARTLDQMQTTLQGTDSIRGSLTSRFLLISQHSSPLNVTDAARAGRDGFKDMVSGLNARIGDRTLFAGSAVDTVPLADSETMLTSILASLGGATTAAAIEAGVAAWFDTPGGGFDTVGYLGATTGPQNRTISETETATLDANAADPALREVLRGAALAAVADALSGTIDNANKAALVQSSGAALLSAAAPLSFLQGRLGETEADVARVATTNAARLSTYKIARSDLVGADPFETATRLQDVQVQLETHYAVTARLSRLSLVDYIR
jgi:flagellar hook-associated protein 3 FlgL